MPMSPLEMLNKIKSSAKLDDNKKSSVAIKLNKPGKIKLQLLAMDPEHLFKARIQHFIQTLPDNEDPNEKIMVVECQGENCPICDAAQSFKNSGITVEDLNEAYKSKYPYTKLRSFLTQPEHYLIVARVLTDNADEGSYLPKDAEIGSTQLIQFSKSALTSLMASYEDFLTDNSDNGEDIDSLPPLFGIFENGATKVKSLAVNLRIQVQGAWSYLFTFGKAVEVDISEVDKDKLSYLESNEKPTEDYVEKAVARIKEIQKVLVNAKNGPFYAVASTVNNSPILSGNTTTEVDNTVNTDINEFDLDIDTL